MIVRLPPLKRTTDVFGPIPRSIDMARAILRARPIPPPKPSPKGLVIGHTAHAEPHILLDQDRFSTHLHLIGPSGFGKSFLLYSLICQDILAGRGVCVIDPHSELYYMVLNFLVQRQISPERVIVVNPLLDRWTARLNPLQGWDGMGSGTSLACESMIRVAGAENFQETPRLGRYLQAAAWALEEAGEPLALLRSFCATDLAGVAFRARLIARIQDFEIQREWQEFAEYTKTMQRDAIDSSVNRVTPFIQDPRIRRMMSFSDGNLDWKEVMDEGKIVLCNLGDIGGRSLSEQARQLIGVLTMHGIRRAAKRRTKGSRPFCVYCDEFGSYVSEEFADGLDSFRKFGVFLTLAHQRLYQVEKESKNVLDAIQTNCKVKLVFGGLHREDADRMAKELFSGEVSGEQVKHETRTRSFKPILTWVDITSHVEGGASGSGGGSTSMSGSGSGTTTLYTPDGILGYTETGLSTASSFHGAQAESESWSDVQSWSDVVTHAPLTVFEEFFQDPSVQFYSLEEGWEKKIAFLMNLPRRTVVVKSAGKTAIRVSTLTINEHIAAEQALLNYEADVCGTCPHITPSTEADGMLTAKLRTYQLLPAPTPAEPMDFSSQPSSIGERRRQRCPVTR